MASQRRTGLERRMAAGTRTGIDGDRQSPLPAVSAARTQALLVRAA